jgi:two-component system alkaline phosphatase synthesis response regulator PhoP
MKKLITAIKESTNDSFTKTELLELISALNKEQPVLQSNGFTFNPDNYTVTDIYNNPVRLVRKEFKLLYYLVSHSDICLNRSTLLNNIWGSNIVVGARTIDVHIRKIKAKININCIQTLKGIGYMWATN